MPVFVVRGVEHVYDAFDEYEHANPLSARVSAESLAMALARGPEWLQALVDERRTGFHSSGMFFCYASVELGDSP